MRHQLRLRVVQPATDLGVASSVKHSERDAW